MSHSNPFAAWREASVTPSTAGACWAAIRSSRSRTSSGRRAPGVDAASRAARSTSALSDSHRERAAPPVAGAS